MVVAYCTYLVTSAVANRDDKQCNPLTARAEGAQTSMVVLGAVFTFLAIAYSTSRAATQSKALGRQKSGGGGGGAIRLPDNDGTDEELATVVNREQPSRNESLRQQALRAAVEAGSLPASALDESRDIDDESDPGAPGADENDDERRGTAYDYTYFHIIFFLSTMYIAMLLTNWNVVSINDGGGDTSDDGAPVKIGRSTVAMWVRIVSSWLCLVLYGWSLAAPVLLPDRFTNPLVEQLQPSLTTLGSAPPKYLHANMDTTSSMHTQRRPSGSSKPAPANLPLFRFASSSTLSGNSNKKKQHRSSSSSSISSVDSSSSSSSSSYSDSFTTSPSPSPSLESSPSLGSSGGSDIGSEDEDAIKNEIRQYW
ncbi:Membrane protein tms1 [Cystobasidiomycetes sp. EMM_F5]